MPTQLSGSINLSGSISATGICALSASYALNAGVISNTGSYDSQIIIVPRTMLYNDVNDDVPSGSTNLSRTSLLQGYIDSASAIYTASGSRPTLVFPSGSMNINEVVLMPGIIYSAAGDVKIKKAENASSSLAFASLVRTRRMGGDGQPDAYGILTKYIAGGIVAGSGDQAYFTASYTGALYRGNSTQALPTGSITRRDKCIAAVLAFTRSYANADNVYGASDDMTFTGPGKFIFALGSASVSAPIMYLREVRNFTVNPGVIEVHHNPDTSSIVAHWGIRIGGRNITWYDPIVKYGMNIAQDGFHISHGRNIRVYGGHIESGDDSYALGTLNNGYSNIDPDEAVEDVSISNTSCISERGRAFCVVVGKNYMSVPYNATGGLNIRRIQATNLHGVSPRTNDQSAIIFYADTDIGRIYKYRIVNSGSGYPINDDFVCNVIPSGSGGSGAQAVIRVESGSITYAWPRYMSNVNGSGSGEWAFGSNGYARDATVDLSPLGVTGSTVTGSVTAIRNVYSNEYIEDIKLSGKFTLGSNDLDWSGSTGNGTNPSGPVGVSGQPVGFQIHCGRRIDLDLGLTFNEGKNSALGGFRVFDISAGEDIKIQMNMNNACSKSGLIRNADSSSATDRISIINSNFVGISSQFPVIKFDGQIGDIYFNNVTCKDIRDSKTFIEINNFETKPTRVSRLTMTNCTFVCSGSFVTGRWLFLSTGSGVTTPCIGNFIAMGNDIANAVGSTATKAQFKDRLSLISNWAIRDNVGYSTYNRRIVTIPSGSSGTGPITASTDTGIPSSSMSSSAACISITPIDNNTTSTTYWRTYDPVSASYAINTNGTASAGGYSFTVIEDTSTK